MTGAVAAIQGVAIVALHDRRMHHLTQLAETYVHEFGLIIVFVSVLLDSFGMPPPGESIIVSTAVLAAQGDLNLPMMLFLAWLGSVIGDNIGYAIGRFAGRELVANMVGGSD